MNASRLRLELGLAGILACLLVVLGPGAAPRQVQGADAVVRAVLFFSPTCPHCEQVISRDLPPITDRFGEQLQLVYFNVGLETGAGLYQAAIEAFDVPAERRGVPTLIIGDSVLVGSIEIPELLPGLIEKGLTQGGTDWPAIPGLVQALSPLAPAPGPTGESADVAASGAPASSAPSLAPAPDTAEADLSVVALLARFERDPVGNSVAISVLIGLLVALAIAGLMVLGSGRRAISTPASQRWWLIGALALAGLAVAAYLAIVEVSGSSAICGPVGDCNAVHESVYARLLGVPIGLLGVLGYGVMLGCWVLARRTAGVVAHRPRLSLFLLAVGGTLFSIYLTFLEPFVIGATCGWCLVSAVTMAAILLLAAPGGRAARARGSR